MNYKLILTDKYLAKGINRIFELQKVDRSDWLPNEDLIQMISSIAPSDYERFFSSVINDYDFNFMEYYEIILSNELLNENNIDNENMLFMLFEDNYSLPKSLFLDLVIQKLTILIDNYTIISEKFKVKILDKNLLISLKEKLKEKKQTQR